MRPAWCWRKRGVRFGTRLDEHDVELLTAPRLVQELPLTGTLITADALYCQRAFCAQIRAAGGDYLVVVKGNQPRLHQDIMVLFETPPPETVFASAEQQDRHGDRHEVRRVWTSGELFGYLAWPGARQVGESERIVHHKGQVRSQVLWGGNTSDGPEVAMLRGCLN